MELSIRHTGNLRQFLAICRYDKILNSFCTLPISFKQFIPRPDDFKCINKLSND